MLFSLNTDHFHAQYVRALKGEFLLDLPDWLCSCLCPPSSPFFLDWCSNPGGVTSMSEELEGCTWEFDATEIDGFPDHDMSMYVCMCVRAAWADV